MSKYAQKLRNIINMVEYSEIFDMLDGNTVVTSEHYKKFIDKLKILIDDKQEPEVSLIKTEKLTASHSKSLPPLMYIFFKAISDLKITPEFDNFDNFVEWYRENQQNLLEISYKVSKYLQHHTNKEISQIYEAMYNQTGARKILHDLLYDNAFIGLDIQHYCESTDLTYEEYKINNCDRLKVFLPVGHNFTELNEICDIYSLMHKLAGKPNNKPAINLTVVYTPQKKLFAGVGKTFCPDNINSGMTEHGKTVCCWRREELSKVVIHELVHFFSLDFFGTAQHSDKITVGLINGKDSINEAYTETLAILIKCGIISGKLKKNYLEIFSEEIIFTFFQVAKIIYLSGGTCWNDFASNKITLNQTTSVRSYFIIKMILLCNLNDLLIWLNGNMKISDRIDAYLDFVNSAFANFVSNKKAIKQIDKFCKLISTFDENDKKHFIFKTARMSFN